MLNRPSVIELDTNQFDNFLGKRGKARRDARRAEKLAQGQIQTNVPVDPMIAGALPIEIGKKPKPSDTLGVPKPSETGTTKTADAGSSDTTDETFLSKHGKHIVIGVVVLLGGYLIYRKIKSNK
jgi:hypothetical protein